MIVFRSSEIFRKYPFFRTFQKFPQKVWKKFGNLSLEITSNINRILCQLQKFQKNYVKFEFFGQKTLFLGQRVREKIR